MMISYEIELGGILSKRTRAALRAKRTINSFGPVKDSGARTARSMSAGSAHPIKNVPDARTQSRKGSQKPSVRF